jgi:hypothetical protein
MRTIAYTIRSLLALGLAACTRTPASITGALKSTVVATGGKISVTELTKDLVQSSVAITVTQ